MVKKKKEKPKFELTFKTAAQVLEERKDIKKISTGTPIDELVGGGIEQGTVIEVYGEYGCLPYETWIKVPQRERVYKYPYATQRQKTVPYKKIYKLKKGDKIIAYDPETGKFEEDTVLKLIRRFLRKDEMIFRITTDEGHIIEATGNHPVLTNKGFIEVANLKIGDSLFAESETPEEYKKIPKHPQGGPRHELYFVKGKPSWNKGKQFPKKTRRKMSVSKRNFMKNYPEVFKEICSKGLIASRKKIGQTMTEPHKTLIEILAKLYGIEIEYPIKTNFKTVFADIALPKQQIAVFYDGEYWHSEDEDIKETHELEKSGWKVIRVKGEIDRDKIMETLKSSLFVKDPKIIKIEEAKWNFVYDLRTSRFHNYIANGLIVHNSGKTQFSLSLICNVKGEVVFIDCEDTFKPERLAEIAETRGLDPKEVLARVHLIQPTTVDEQVEALNHIPPNLKPELIIVDGLTTLFREEYIGRERLVERQGQLRLHLRALKNYAKQTKTVIIVTNQVYARPDATPFTPLEFLELAVGGHTLYHSIDNRIFIRKGSQGTRVAKLVDSSAHPPAERTFIITEKGVEAKPEKEEEKAEAKES